MQFLEVHQNGKSSPIFAQCDPRGFSNSIPHPHGGWGWGPHGAPVGYGGGTQTLIPNLSENGLFVRTVRHILQETFFFVKWRNVQLCM